jgi:hypothetical protein
MTSVAGGCTRTLNPAFHFSPITVHFSQGEQALVPKLVSIFCSLSITVRFSCAFRGYPHQSLFT